MGMKRDEMCRYERSWQREPQALPKLGRRRTELINVGPLVFILQIVDIKDLKSLSPIELKVPAIAPNLDEEA